MKQLLAAAEAGDATAQFNFGIVCDNRLENGGPGTGVNRAEAIKWMRQAAEQGLPLAQARLAEIYAEAPGAGSDQVRAYTWFLLAATSLNGAHRQRAQSGYERLGLHMTPARVAKAKRLAGAWRPTRRKDSGAGAEP